VALALSALDLVVSACFTLLVAAQWVARRRPHQLLWAAALLVWTLAVGAETAAAWNGIWSPMTYRLYYAFGALMVAAWLGAGSLHLSASPRLARAFTWVVAGLSIVSGILIFTYPIDTAKLAVVDSLGFVDTTLVKVFPFVPVRMFVVLANILGTLAFVGSALYSLWRLRGGGFSGARTTGVLLIAVGGLVAASTHSLGAIGGPGLFRVGELAAILFIFSGYVLSSRRLPEPAAAAAPA